MLRLGVATQAETFERMRDPLATRDIEVVSIETAERSVPIGEDPFPSIDVGFVYPPRLAEGGVADALLAVPWVNDREAVLRSRQKGETIARLSRAGVPVPETVVVSDPADEATLRAAYERVGSPAVVKPNATTRGIGVTKIADVDSFLGVCDYLDLVHDYRATGDRSFLVQEYLPDARDYRVTVLDGSVVGAVERRTDGWVHNVHRGGEARRVELPDRERALAERAAGVLGIDWLGVDLLVSDGRAVVSETNARPTIDDGKYRAGFWDELAAVVRSRAAES